MKTLRNGFTLIACLVLSGQAVLAQQTRLDAGTKILIPSSAHTANFSSFLAVINLDSQPNNIRITARRTDGSVIGTPINTVINVDSKFRSTDILGEMGAVSGDFGPITIESTNGKMLSAVSEVSSTQGTAGFFPGVNVQSAWMQGFIPEVIDTGEQGQAGTFRTNLGLNTIDGTAVSVKVSLHDNSGGLLGSANISVAGNGMTQLRVRDSISALGGTNGYLLIESNRPIHAWASKINNGSNDPSFEIGVGALSGVVSQIAPPIDDYRNNLLFVILALLAPLVLALRRSQTAFSQGINQGTWATETL
ncbi:MAG TPA: hypothetical protein VMW38_08980 [Terriglobia bacterium]|nr:hypothetical protein [Terriglobia bacterium]